MHTQKQVLVGSLIAMFFIVMMPIMGLWMLVPREHADMGFTVALVLTVAGAMIAVADPTKRGVREGWLGVRRLFILQGIMFGIALASLANTLLWDPGNPWIEFRDELAGLLLGGVAIAPLLGSLAWSPRKYPDQQ